MRNIYFKTLSHKYICTADKNFLHSTLLFSQNYFLSCFFSAVQSYYYHRYTIMNPIALALLLPSAADRWSWRAAMDSGVSSQKRLCTRQRHKKIKKVTFMLMIVMMVV